MKIKKRKISASRKALPAKRRIMAASITYDQMIQKIQYYAKKIIADIYEAAEIIGNHQFVNISVPDVDIDDRVDPDLFFNWYVTDYVDNFDANHPGGEIVEVDSWGAYRRLAYNVAFGVLDGSELEDLTEATPRGGSNVEMNAQALMSIVTGWPFMEDTYFVTEEYGFTLKDLADDPYTVFDNFNDEEQRIFEASEVLDEMDLWTQSDQRYPFAKSAAGLIELYDEVDEYFSYGNASRLYDEYVDGMDFDEDEE